MKSRLRSRAVNHPITVKGRIYLSVTMVLIALVLGFATSVGLYQVFRTHLRQSASFGRLFCGEGLHVDDTTSGSRSRRLICRDGEGTEVGPRNNLIAVKMALPFILIYGGTGILLAWTIGARRGGQ